MKDTTILITGGNSGIGFAAAQMLAKAGATTVLLARNKTKGQSAIEEIKKFAGHDRVGLVIGDLSNLSSLQLAAEQYKTAFGKLDILINNAGGMFPEKKTTQDGFEYTFGINHLGHFYLTAQLLDLLKASPQGKIINVASEASKMGTMDFEDLMFDNNNYSELKAYGRAKLANIIFTYSLAEKLKETGIQSYSMHPGPVRTNFGNESKGIMKWMIKLMRPFFLTPKQGADTIVWLASEKQPGEMNGKYFAKRKPIQSKLETYESKVQEQLWQISEKLTGASYA